MSTRNAGSALRRFYILFGVVGVVGIGVLGYSLGRGPREAIPTMPVGSSGGGAQGAEPAEPRDAEGGGGQGGAATMPVPLENAGDFTRLQELAAPIARGSPGAPATILVFNHFLCPVCSWFSLRVRPQLEASLVETGQARLLVYDFPLSPGVGQFLAARAARCAADQGRYWEYHDWLYRMQLTWEGHPDKLAVFQQYAKRLGLDAEQFRGCLNSDRHAVAVSASMAMARLLGLSFVPSVLVESPGGGSRILPSSDFETIRAAVQGTRGG